MKIEELDQLAIDVTAITTATPLNDNEIILLADDEVKKYKIKEKKLSSLFSTVYNENSEEEFDCSAPSSIYCLDDIVVVVNDYTPYGYIYNPHTYGRINLCRGKYQVKHSHYPIALYKDDDGTPLIIFAEDWNHIQIMNLDTLQVLTADKSLIEVGAEDRHRNLYANKKMPAKYKWPSSFDYFYGKLLLSPDNKYFMSMGWYWGSSDGYNIFNIDHFLTNNRIYNLLIATEEHLNRPACWIDKKTIAVAYDPMSDDWEEAQKGDPCEIHFIEINEGKSEIKKKVLVRDLDLIGCHMHYNESLDILIFFSKDSGIFLLSLAGELLYQDSGLKIDNYFSSQNILFTTESNSIKRYKLH